MNTRQLMIDGNDRQDRPRAKRVCGCDCGESIDHLSERAKYLDNRHAMRAYRKRVKAEMERVGLPPLPSLRAAGVSRPMPHHNGEPQNEVQGARSRSRSGAQVSYPKAVEAAARLAMRIVEDNARANGVRLAPGVPASVHRLAQIYMARELSDRQRAQLHAREEKRRAA